MDNTISAILNIRVLSENRISTATKRTDHEREVIIE
jgi:hypothetical protein